MIKFTCTCKYMWVLNLLSGEVFGPIYTDLTMGCARVRTFQSFSEEYGDCYEDLKIQITNRYVL
jgi:hypothetical protein